VFGRSKGSSGSEASTGGARVVKNGKRTTSDVDKITRSGRHTHPSGKYEARCDDDGYSLTGLPKRDAEAFAEIHDYEQHNR
jgi:hypothetical protein